MNNEDDLMNVFNVYKSDSEADDIPIEPVEENDNKEEQIISIEESEEAEVITEVEDEPVEEVEEEPEPEPEVKAPVIEETNDGISIVTNDDIIEDDETPAIVSGVPQYVVPPKVEQDLMFGKTNLHVSSEEEIDDPVVLLNRLKYYGDSLDIYLPVSNVAIRVYEFNNEVFVDRAMGALQTMYSDNLVASPLFNSSLSRQLLRQIQNNCKFLCKDSETLNNMFAFDSLSKSDMEFILMGVSALLCYVNNGAGGRAKNYIYPLEVQCENCSASGHDVKIDFNIDLIQLLKQQYANHKIKDIQQKINEYSMEDTFSEKLKKSMHNRKYKITFSVKNSVINVYIGDPSYGAFKQAEDDLFTYILNKYDQYITPLSRNIGGYSVGSSARKLNSIINGIATGTIMMNPDVRADITSDYESAQISIYIDRLEFSSKSDPSGTKTVTKMSELTPQKKLDVIASLPKKLLDNCQKGIIQILELGSKPLDIVAKCTQCTKETELKVSPIQFFFSVLDRIIPERE